MFNVCKQKYEFDCVLACVTTLLQKPYEELWTREDIELARSEKGYSTSQALQKVGLNENTDYWKIYPNTLWATDFQAKSLLNGRRAILIVPSLNNPNAQHAVYWHGETLYDPSNKQQYQWLDQLILRAVFVFNEMLRKV